MIQWWTKSDVRKIADIASNDTDRQKELGQSWDPVCLESFEAPTRKRCNTSFEIADDDETKPDASIHRPW